MKTFVPAENAEGKVIKKWVFPIKERYCIVIFEDDTFTIVEVETDYSGFDHDHHYILPPTTFNIENYYYDSCMLENEIITLQEHNEIKQKVKERQDKAEKERADKERARILKIEKEIYERLKAKFETGS